MLSNDLFSRIKNSLGLDQSAAVPVASLALIDGLVYQSLSTAQLTGQH